MRNAPAYISYAIAAGDQHPIRGSALAARRLGFGKPTHEQGGIDGLAGRRQEGSASTEAIRFQRALHVAAQLALNSGGASSSRAPSCHDGDGPPGGNTGDASAASPRSCSLRNIGMTQKSRDGQPEHCQGAPSHTHFRRRAAPRIHQETRQEIVTTMPILEPLGNRSNRYEQLRRDVARRHDTDTKVPYQLYLSLASKSTNYFACPSKAWITLQVPGCECNVGDVTDLVRARGTMGTLPERG